MKNVNEMSVKEIICELSYEQKDGIYRALWFEHVHEDVVSHAEDMDLSFDESTIEELANNVAELYVYHGKYDCNLSYWDNIENLINEVTHNF